MSDAADGSRHEVQRLLGITFSEPALLDEALTHASAKAPGRPSNERLEFLGDAVLDVVVCEHLYNRLPDENEGRLTRIKSAVVSGPALARAARALGLTDHLTVGKGMARSRTGALPDRLAANAMEAVIGAIHLDAGMEAARTFVLEHMEPEIDRVLEGRHDRNWKTLLQQHTQENGGPTPRYRLLSEEGPAHRRRFQVRVAIGDDEHATAWGLSKKEAEQRAARLTLEALTGQVEGDMEGDADEDAADTERDAEQDGDAR